jgi:LPPG:FO 2-phospho-L-lactate transferase
VHSEEYWARLQAQPDTVTITQVGLEAAALVPGVIEALTHADLILVALSNPVVSIGSIVAVRA